MAVGFAALGLALLVLVLIVGTRRPSAEPEYVSPFPLGSVQHCMSDPSFLHLIGFLPGSVLDTRAKYVKGVALHELDQDGHIVRSYTDPSWSSAGYLGSLQRDESGNVYLIPAPFISTLDNPPQKANVIYRIDSETGKMSPLVDLPMSAPATPQNIYGLMDITYDCDTHSLYASSIYGSTYDTVSGSIFQVDPKTGAVKSILGGVDAIGLGVFNTLHGKRLYFGLARSPEIYSVGLDENGGLTHDVRPELSLEGLGLKSDERARLIIFQEQSQLAVKTVQFDFNLVAPTETEQTVLNYVYDSQQDKWQLTSSQVINE